MQHNSIVKVIFLLWIILLSSPFFLLSCKKESGGRSAVNQGQPPFARAGTDQVVYLPADSIWLDGSGSYDPNEEITSYRWEKIAGPAGGNIANPTSRFTLLSGLTVGTYSFVLTVKNAHGLSASDTIIITVARWTRDGNVHFYFRDPTGSLNGVLEGTTPRVVLARVRIPGFPDGEIEGVWGLSITPICPIAANYVDPTAFGSFNLPPGTYQWTAESVTLNPPGYPLAPAFFQWWGSGPHYASGTVTVNQGETCIIKRIDF